MRELIGYLVACRGAEQAAARMAVGIPQRFLCKRFLCKQFLCTDDRADHALIHDESIGAGIGIPISIVLAHESFTGATIAGASPGFGVFD
jgi:hypothetical protein